MNRFYKKIIILLFIFTAVFIAADFALAAADFGLDYGRAIGLADTDPRVAIANLIRIALTFLGIIAVIIIMYGGFLWMTAAGDAEKVNKAKKVLINAIIGLIIILSAFLIVTFVVNRIGGAISGCDPACLAGEKCCGNDNCIPAADTCCGTGSCGTGLKCCGTNPPDCRADCGSPLPPDSFYINAKNPPEGAVDVIKNIKVRFTFNAGVDSTTVNNSSFTVTDAGGNEIGGSRAVRGRTVEFTPSGDCGNNTCNAGNVCFASGTAVTVAAVDGAAGIFSVGGTILACGGFSPDCTLHFTVGSAVDCQKPSIEYNSTWQTCIDTPNQIGFTASDDYGVSQVEISDSNGNRGFLMNPDTTSPLDPILVPCPGPGNCGQLPSAWNEPNAASWQPEITSGYSTGTAYTISLKANDLDNNEITVSRSYTLRDAHCCNGLLDAAEGETGVDCGGDCAACNGAACGVNLNATCGAGNTANCDNSRCASGFCNCGTFPAGVCQTKGYGAAAGDNCCVCEARPFIDWVSPTGGFCGGSINTACRTDAECSAFTPNTCNMEDPNGAPGNLFTIHGRNFGTSTGHVWFVDAAGSQIAEAGLADSANAACTAVWTDDQIIAVVPNGVGNDRRVRVIENSTGNNFYGDSFDTFLINSLERPGICSLNPEHGLRNVPIAYQGIRLNGGTAYFGDLDDSVIALNSSFLNPDSGTAAVPDIRSGRTTSYVLTPQNINSNFYRFIKDNEAPVGPQITSFSPASGAPGQYVTIMGRDFGTAKGTSRVFFEATEADYDFPAVCADSVWSDNQVIVKVPAGLSGNYTIRMNIGTWPQIDTSQLSPGFFLADASLPLLPSLCKIFPVMGPNNAPVSLWGEYFGLPAQTSGTVRFYNLQDKINVALTKDGQADKAETTVPQMALSGPVSLIQGSGISNGLNFRVGKCQSPADCGGAPNICCPVGTYQAGQCAADIKDCYVNIPGSVFEWDVSTGYGTSTPCYNSASAGNCDLSLADCPLNQHCDVNNGCICVQNAATCSGYDLNQCNNSLFCPNSPGTCSTYAGGLPKETGTCSYDCDNVGTCTSGTCRYLPAIDKCVQDPDNNCDLASTTRDRLGNMVSMYCADYNNNGRWHINTSLSCPDGWVSLIGGRCASTLPCDICSAGYACLNDNDNDDQGLCGTSKELCPGSATCNNTDHCTVTDNARCECCCEKGQDARDCCAPLVCDNTCGAGTVGSINYGVCSGCASVGTTVADHDAACNCSGSSGKYCDLSVSGGVCQDCAGLGTTADCNDHNTTCCVDGKNNNNCRGGDGTQFPAGSDYGFCPYYNCSNNIGSYANSCDPTPLTASGLYDNLAACSQECQGSGIGESCASQATTNTVCDISVCSSPFACMNSSLSPLTPPDNCGYCCCDPSSANDCSTINPKLNCSPDKSPCSGSSRGLCCGCEEDGDCVHDGQSAANTGCGADTCCHPRPNPIPSLTAPPDSPALPANICRNAEISVEFDTLMDPASFIGNVIVFGDYESDPCPDGTVYLADSGFQPARMNLFVKIYYKTRALVGKILSPILPHNIAEAWMEIPTTNSNYCAITGSVKSSNLANGHTEVSFSVSRPMDEDRLYYALIKGDNNLDSKTGVKSRYGVGMNGPNASAVFNGISYSNAYIWSFRTLSGNGGVCKMDSVKVSPSSYLFKTNRNDANENDADPVDNTFDTVKDSDKVFTAKPVSNTGQRLVSLAGVYSWVWSWVSNNSAVADSVAGVFSEPDKTLLRANPEATEGKTILTATADITDQISSGAPVADVKRGSADVYLFVCANPWPPVDSIGEWHPWIDRLNNCSLALNGCGNSNYEMYYCRDSGAASTYDDLPAIVSNDTIIRGRTDSVFKEFYFFRENIPDVTSLFLSATVPPEGGKAALSWIDIFPPVNNYKIYYGRASGNYTYSVIASSTSQHSPANPFIVDNLTNNVTYYFNITAASSTGAESQPDIAKEISATPKDIEPAGIPQDLRATSSDKAVILGWNSVDGAVSYIVSFGANNVNYASRENVGNVTSVEVADLTNGNTYYFAVNSVDNSGNVSATSTQISAIPVE